MSGRAPDFVLKEMVELYMDSQNTVKLMPGTFVRPVDMLYVPQHIKDDSRWRHMDKTTHVFCYTHYGFMPIPKKAIRATS